MRECVVDALGGAVQTADLSGYQPKAILSPNFEVWVPLGID
jgi:hypothetical protein